MRRRILIGRNRLAATRHRSLDLGDFRFAEFDRLTCLGGLERGENWVMLERDILRILQVLECLVGSHRV